MTYTMLNDFQNAKNYYEKAAELNTLLYNGYYDLAQIAMIYDDLEEAENFFQKSIQGEEVEAGSYYYLAKIAMLKGEQEKAVTYLNLAIDLDISVAKLAEEEDIFIPIKKYIVIPNKEVEELKDKNTASKMEQITWNHLKETQEIVGTLSYRDFRIEKKKEEKTYEQETKERQED